MKKWLFIIVTLLIMLVISLVLSAIIDGMVQINNDYLILGIFLSVFNFVIGMVSYFIYKISTK